MTLLDKIKEVDIISDVSGTICKEEIPKAWIRHHARLLAPLQKIKLLGKAAINYGYWLWDKDPSHFYDTLQGLPFWNLDFVYDLTPNPSWDDTIKDIQPKTVGVITQDDHLIVNIYLASQKQRFKDLGIEVAILEANHAKLKSGVYTGEVKLNVTLNTLPDLLLKYPSTKHILGDNPINQVIQGYPDLVGKFINVQ